MHQMTCQLNSKSTTILNEINFISSSDYWTFQSIENYKYYFEIYCISKETREEIMQLWSVDIRRTPRSICLCSLYSSFIIAVHWPNIYASRYNVPTLFLYACTLSKSNSFIMPKWRPQLQTLGDRYLILRYLLTNFAKICDIAHSIPPWTYINYYSVYIQRITKFFIPTIIF